MAPVLFNLYTCLVMECWQARVEGVGGVNVKLRYKYDHKLFRLYTRNAVERKLTGCFFADDGALLASSRPGAERAVGEYQAVYSEFGLTVSIPKTTHLVTGRKTVGSDESPIKVNDGKINSVDEFQYLGSRITASRRMDRNVEMRI